MKEVAVMTGYLKGSKYAIKLHRIISKTIKELGIAKNLTPKERSEKISEFNAYLKEIFEKHGVKKYYSVIIVVKIIGDENNFEIHLDKVFVLKPYAIIEKDKFTEVGDEEFEKIYDDTIETVLKQEDLKNVINKDKKSKKGEDGETRKEMSLLDFFEA